MILDGDLDAAIANLDSDSPEAQERAWRLLYMAINPQLLEICARWGVAADDAEDVVAETWIRAWKKQSEGKLPSDHTGLRKYVRSICRNLLRDGTRVRREMISLDDSHAGALWKELISAAVPGDAAFSLSANDITLARSQLLAKLSPPEVELYDLYSRGFSIDEIAAELNLKRNAVDARIHRLRNRLRGLVETIYLFRLLFPDSPDKSTGHG